MVGGVVTATTKRISTRRSERIKGDQLDICIGSKMGIQSDEGTCCGGNSDACGRKGEHHVHNRVEIEKEENDNGEISGNCDYEVDDSVSEK